MPDLMFSVETIEASLEYQYWYDQLVQSMMEDITN
jgi:hypothetical protein